jgi:uncharacterized protein
MDIGNRLDFLRLAGLVEGGTVLLALVIGWLAGVNPWSDVAWTWPAVGIGLVATAPIFLVYGFARDTRTVAIEAIGPALSLCRWYDLIVLAALAGLGEELLFRGVLQPWLSRPSPWIGFVAANVLFGLVHLVTPTYGLIAGGLGMYLSVVAFHLPGGNLLSAIIAHGLYDYVAFLLIVREYRSRQPDGEAQPVAQTGAEEPDAVPESPEDAGGPPSPPPDH